ncbi:predicted protein [Naegleria gruberi]|uniref:Predicted protein n=1 Tax=Naegleria gruberi TaxID=5762 RepID=D2VY66_NAEGR|nr:uncharacterized protein NAEGRDRAFT_73989 [Naegleria gruberi]EFC38312.1 predicted protein [Naegleria gruberi]|eukprot:XP_002671056.1 predicted protein [Naegleria gruberi strain NEG-M]
MQGSTSCLLINEKNNGTTTSTYKLHPLVMLNILDHYQRVAFNSKTDIIGCLFGEFREGGYFEIKNTIPLKFTENTTDIDVSYYKKMESLHHRVYSNDTLIGFYTISTSKTTVDKQIYQSFSDNIMKSPLVLDCTINVPQGNETVTGRLIDFKGYMNRELKFKDKVVGTLFEQVRVEYIMTDNEKLSMNYLQTNKYLQSNIVLQQTIQQLKKDLEEIGKYLQSSNKKNFELYHFLLSSFQLLKPVDDFDKTIGQHNKDLQMIVYLSHLLQQNLKINEQLTTTSHEL